LAVYAACGHIDAAPKRVIATEAGVVILLGTLPFSIRSDAHLRSPSAGRPQERNGADERAQSVAPASRASDDARKLGTDRGRLTL